MTVIKIKGLDKLQNVLGALDKRSVNHVQKDALNDMVFDTRRKWVRQIKHEFILKNSWTEKSIRINKATTSNLKAVVGSTLDYMATQETGGFKESKGSSKSAPIATAYAAGQKGKRTKLPKRGNALRQLKNVWKGSGSNNHVRNQVAMRKAVQSPSRKPYLYMEIGNTKGIFQIPSRKRINAQGVAVAGRLKMVHNLSKDRYRIKPSPTLAPTLVGAQSTLDHIYKERLEERILFKRR